MLIPLSNIMHPNKDGLLFAITNGFFKKQGP